MNLRKITTALGLVLGLSTVPICLFSPLAAATTTSLSGHILGDVRSSAGIAQMGAAVFLYNRYDELVRQTLSNQAGKFVFEGLTPDLYSVRVTLASFVPAVRRNIAIGPGTESLLKISLATVLSTIELLPSTPTGTLLADEWKWVLRTSQATRPVLRIVGNTIPNVDTPQRARKNSGKTATSFFSPTAGMVSLSAGDSTSAAGEGGQDLGTAFVLSGTLHQTGKVRFSGNVGYGSNSALPSAGFRTTYSGRNSSGGPGPVISLTVRQLYLPGFRGSGTPLPDSNGIGEAGPVLRTTSFGVADTLDFTDGLRLEYGANLESIAFLHRLSYLSPFARATYDAGSWGSYRVAFSSGTSPLQLIAGQGSASSSELNEDLAALALLPRVSRREGDLRMQRSQNWEAGYRLVRGASKIQAAMYREDVSDAAFTLALQNGTLLRTDVLPQLGSRSLVFNVGDYHRTGYAAAFTETVGGVVDLTFAGGQGGALISDAQEHPNTGSDVRNSIHKTSRTWLSARASTTLPKSGTKMTTSYGWTDFRVLMPTHLSLTGDTYQDMGWNLGIRQPVPNFGIPGGRMEVSAELRNMLAQGYLPISGAGRRAILTNSPRSLRGGVSFIF